MKGPGKVFVTEKEDPTTFRKRRNRGPLPGRLGSIPPTLLVSPRRGRRSTGQYYLVDPTSLVSRQGRVGR